MTYQQLLDPVTGQINTSQIKQIAADGTISIVPNNNLNKDWVAYQAWLAAGNTPEAAG